MDEIEPTPLEWLRSAWVSDPLEILLPSAAGALFAHALTGAFILRSYHHILLALCLMALGASISQSAAFFLQLGRGRKAGISTTVSARKMQLLFVPPITAIVLWAIIAPNFWLGSIFALMSLPHLLLLAYMSKRYAADASLLEGRLTTRLDAWYAHAALLYLQARSSASLAFKSLRTKTLSS